MKFSYILSLVILLTFFSIEIHSQTINVGAYIFPPFMEKKNSGFYGITIDLINEMNKFQNQYTFELFETSAKRRYSHFEDGSYDMIIFEDINWGWQAFNMNASKVFLSGSEVYICRNEYSRDQNYFDDFTEKSISVILGYHYGFAGFISDEQYLRDNFNIQFGRDHETIILKVLEGRSDISVVTKSYLTRFLNENPQYKNQLIISDKQDQVYNHRILLNKNSAISVVEINNLLLKMEEAHILTEIWEKYGIEKKIAITP